VNLSSLNPYGLYIKALSVVLVLACVVGVTHHYTALSYEKAMTAHLLADAKAQAQAEKAARTAEHKLAAANQAAAAQYEKGRQDAQAAGKRVADDLRAGNIRLRQRWQGCVVPGAAPGAPVADDAASGRADSAGRIVAATHDDAEKIKALQDLLRSERK